MLTFRLSVRCLTQDFAIILIISIDFFLPERMNRAAQTLASFLIPPENSEKDCKKIEKSLCGSRTGVEKHLTSKRCILKKEEKRLAGQSRDQTSALRGEKQTWVPVSKIKL